METLIKMHCSCCDDYYYLPKEEIDNLETVSTLKVLHCPWCGQYKTSTISKDDMHSVLSMLTEKEKKALNEAMTVIHLNDRSDYINGLWGVVEAILGELYNSDSFDEVAVYKALNPDSE